MRSFGAIDPALLDLLDIVFSRPIKFVSDKLQLAFDVTQKKVFFLFKLGLLLAGVIKIATHNFIIIKVLIINMIIAILMAFMNV
tara:strand:+ start:21019 stop:21270 length:252 start_codon:yes stop_codon:yes gene_type:complete